MRASDFWPLRFNKDITRSLNFSPIFFSFFFWFIRLLKRLNLILIVLMIVLQFIPLYRPQFCIGIALIIG